jgi:hypothetical protein
MLTHISEFTLDGDIAHFGIHTRRRYSTRAACFEVFRFRSHHPRHLNRVSVHCTDTGLELRETNSDLIPGGASVSPDPPISRPKASLKPASGLPESSVPLQPITSLGRPEADLKEAQGQLIGGPWGCISLQESSSLRNSPKYP